MDIIVQKDQCIGCGCCEASCPKHAINMQKDSKGFYYPIILQDKCIDCGLCKRKCPILNKNVHNDEVTFDKIFAIKHIDDTVRMSSASGGAFTALSDVVFRDGGVVYGAVCNAEGVIEHQRGINHIQRDKMRGSKYAQSDMLMVYSQIQQDLLNNKKVLFTGTPCQVSALYNYLGKDSPNLFTCDIVCHGVMSPQLFFDFQNLIIQKKGKFENINFRNKEYGWKSQQWTINYCLGKVQTGGSIKKFKRLYTRNLAIRESCFQCQFASKKRYSDITISDYWGIAKADAEFEDSLGVSMMWIHTKKGMQLFEKSKDDIHWISGTEKSSEQPQLLGPTQKPKNYDAFWNCYKNFGLGRVLLRYGNKQVILNSFLKLKKLFNKKNEGI